MYNKDTVKSLLSKCYKHLFILEDSLFNLGKNAVVIKTDDELFAQKTKQYILSLIRKFVITSQYNENSFEFVVGKYMDSKYYTELERSFIEEIYACLLDILYVEDVSTTLSDNILEYNMYNTVFQYSARAVYNGVFHKTLCAGDDITEIMNSYCNYQRANLSTLSQKSKMYEWFFEVKNDKFFLRCDLETNKNLFIMNFLNTVLYRFIDDEVKVLLIKKLQAKYGTILRN